MATENLVLTHKLLISKLAKEGKLNQVKCNFVHIPFVDFDTSLFYESREKDKPHLKNGKGDIIQFADISVE